MENIINDFKLFINENEIQEITVNDVNNYIMSLHYDIINEADSFNDIELIENDIEQVIYNNFDIKINN
jgi:hypothetical protein